MPSMPPHGTWHARIGRTVLAETALAAAVLAGLAVGARMVIRRGIPLGWDESVYATMSRALATDIPASLAALYRPPVLPVLGLAGGTLGWTDLHLRTVTLVLGLVALAAAGSLGRLLWGPWAGVLAILALAGSPVVVDEIVGFHTDLPSTGVLVLLMALCWFEFERRPRPTGAFLLAAPLAALAFYLRYGTILALGGIAVTAALLWHRQIREHARLVGATVLLAALLLMPHLLDSMALTGSPIGIIRSANTAADSSRPLASAIQYLRWLPRQLAGMSGFAVMSAGLLFLVLTGARAIIDRRLEPATRRLLWLFGPAAIMAAVLVRTDSCLRSLSCSRRSTSGGPTSGG